MAQDRQALSKILNLAPVIPVIILDEVALARPLAEALVEGGLPVLEVTLRTENAVAVMREMAKVEGAVVGSGTVRNSEHMRQSVDAGCQFMVSPGAPAKLLEAANTMPIPLLPGVASPTEAMAASLEGYSYLKFFPAEAMGGVPVLKSFASPLADLTFCPTGGITPEKAKTYLGLANVVCVGGSWITPADKLDARDFEAIEALARDAAALKR